MSNVNGFNWPSPPTSTTAPPNQRDDLKMQAWRDEALHSLEQFWRDWEGLQAQSRVLLHSLSNLEAQRNAAYKYHHNPTPVSRSPSFCQCEGLNVAHDSKGRGELNAGTWPSVPPLSNPMPTSRQGPISRLQAIFPNLIPALHYKQSVEINRVSQLWRALLPEYEALLDRLTQLQDSSVTLMRQSLVPSLNPPVNALISHTQEMNCSSNSISVVQIATWIDEITLLYRSEWLGRMAMVDHLDDIDGWTTDSQGESSQSNPKLTPNGLPSKATWNEIRLAWSMQYRLDFQLERMIRKRVQSWREGMRLYPGLK